MHLLRSSETYAQVPKRIKVYLKNVPTTSSFVREGKNTPCQSDERQLLIPNKYNTALKVVALHLRRSPHVLPGWRVFPPRTPALKVV